MAEESASVAQTLEDRFNDFAGLVPDTEDTSSKSQETASDDAGDDFEEDQGVEAGSEENAAEEPTEALVEIEVDGEILEVPEKYKDYFLRQQDYTTKTQEVASQRRELEIRQQSVEHQAKEYEFANSVWDDAMKAQQKASEAEQWRAYLRQYVDSSEFSSQGAEQIRQKISDLEAESQKLASDIQGRHKEFQQAQEQSLRELLKKGTEVLQSKIPGWSEESAKQVREYALSNGFSEAEIANVVDPRHVEVLYKASQYDKLRKTTGQAVKKVQAAPSIKQKSRNPMPDDVKKMLNHRKKMKSQGRSPSQKARDMEDFMRERFKI